MTAFIELFKHEFMKVWKNKKFIAFFIVMFILNIGMLWYSTLENDYKPSLPSYRKLEDKLNGFNDNEKLDYAESYYNGLTEESNFEFTDSYEKEKTLLKEVINELKIVCGYNEFLHKTQVEGENISDISIFNSSSGNNYSNKNIEKTVKDYSELQGIEPNFQSGKWIEVATEFYITDILIILMVCLIIYISIFYEKEKNLHAVIRVSKYGKLHTAICKLMAFQLSCIIITVIFYGGNLVYSFVNLSIPNLSYTIQSIAIFSTTTLKISISIYLLIFLISKAIVFIIIGNIMLLIAIMSCYIFIPYISIGFIMVASYTMWKVIIPTSKYAIFKYLNLVGLLDINKVFGEYLNINILNAPINLYKLWLIFVIAFLALINIAIVIAYCRIKKISVRSIDFKRKKFSPHTSLFKHELYKILIMKKGILIIVLFIMATAYLYTNNSYYISGGELKYNQYMKKLEGKLTSEKEEFLYKEKEKFENAEKKVEEIDKSLRDKEITMMQANALKEEYNKILSNYNTFQKVWEKYEFIKKHEGSEFVYDSAYKMLFNYNDNIFKIAAILYFTVIIFVLSVVFPMEYSNSQYRILNTTLLGKKNIEKMKIVISSVLAIIIMGISIGVRYIYISRYYEFSNISAKAISVFGADFWGAQMPIYLVLIIAIGVLLLLSLIFMSIILLVSKKVKNSVYTVVIVCVIIAISRIIFQFGGY
ncbi:MAG: hypothetical protein KIC66_11660 [Clostridium sp.]|uniref:hypothetical protein n=1 Tax=Clostridium sp. TaxID=1506 RepID=UPI0025BD0F81|nr:hypothetical protein [Clostridium sp.]MBS5927721.1 hypothetical protein [Clostridium sp.]